MVQVDLVAGVDCEVYILHDNSVLKCKVTEIIMRASSNIFTMKESGTYSDKRMDRYENKVFTSKEALLSSL